MLLNVLFKGMRPPAHVFQKEKEVKKRMKISKMITGLLAVAGLTALAAGSAMATTTDLGSLIQSTNQNVTLTNGDSVNLLTNVYLNSGIYTYQYDLTNVNDSSGIALFAPTISNANDAYTSLDYFFGSTASGPDNTVTLDSAVGTFSSNNPLTGPATGLTAGEGLNRVTFQDQINLLPAGTDNLGYYGALYYIQSDTAPGNFDINISDQGSADFPGPAPGVPEPSSVAGLGIGLFGLLLMGVLAVRRRAGMLS